MLDDLKDIAKALGVSIVGLVTGIIALIITGVWVVLIPITLIALLYYLIDKLIRNKFLSIIVAYYGTSVIMSIISLLIFYFPVTIGGGLFEAGYIIADFITLNSIIDYIWKIQTDSWGIYYNWTIVISFILSLACYIIYKTKEQV